MKKTLYKICAFMVILTCFTTSLTFNVFGAQITTSFISGWSKFISNEPDATVNIVKMSDGNHAVKFTSNTSYDGTRFMRIFQSVNLEKDTTYVYGLKVKADEVLGAEITFFGNKSSLVPFSKTSNWTNYEFQNTYTQNNASHTFNITVVDVAKGFYVDDIYLYKLEDGKKVGQNMLVNSGFESDTKNAVSDEAVENDDTDNAELTIIDTNEFLETSKSIPIFRVSEKTDDISKYNWENHININIKDVYMINKTLDKADNEASVRYAYDDENFYLNFTVKDNIHHSLLNSSYWSADSVQIAFAPVLNTLKLELGISFDEKTGEIYTTNDDINAKIKRNGEISNYYITVPWSVFTDKLPDKFQFSAIVNDNDNDEYQRKYAHQISLGIVSAKNAEQFPMLYPTDKLKESYFSAIEGASEIYVGCDNTFTLVLQSLLNEKSDYVVTFPDGKTKKVSMPPLSCAKVLFNYKAESVGDKTFDVSIKKDGAPDEDKTCVSHSVRVIPDYAMYLKLYDECEGYYKEIKELTEKCKEKKIPVDYEIADLTVFEMFLEYMKEDADVYGAFDRILYTYNSLKDIYKRCKEDLVKYLNNEKISYAVPKYVNSKVEATDTGFVADMELNGVVERRPMYINGFLNFVQGEEEYANFTKLGANINGLSLKLYDVITPWCEVPEWNLYVRTKENVDYSVTVSDKAAKSGKYSLNYERTTPWGEGRALWLRQAVACKPNTTYKFGLSSKGKYVDGVYFACHKIISSNYGLSQRQTNYIQESDEWVNHEYTYTTGPDDHTLEFIIPLMAPNEQLYIDDIYIIEEGTNKNLIRNGDFEQGPDKEEQEYDYYDGYIREMECRLKELEQANMKVEVLLAANYWPEFVDLRYDDVVDANTLYGEYLRFNTAHPEVKKILKMYVDVTMQVLKKSNAVNDVCVANEPCTYAFNTQYYKPFWYEYLKNIYDNDITKLNTACNTSYEKFEDIDMKEPKEFTLLYKHVMEFNEDILAEYLGYLCSLVKESDPQMAVHAKLLPITLDYGRSALNKGENYEKLSKHFDYNGNDANTAYNHPKQSLLAKMEWYDLQSSVKSAPVLNTEDHFQMDSVNIDLSPKMYKHAMADAWQGVMHNRATSIIWVLEREKQYLVDTTWMNTNLAVRADHLSGHSRAFLDFNRLSYEIKAMQDVKRNVAILYSQNSYNFKPSFQSTLLSAYSNVLFNGQKPLLLVESQMEKLDDYNLLIIPECTHITDNTFNAIEKFVQRGGKLIIIGEDSLYKNEFDIKRDEKKVLNIFNNALIVKTDVSSRSDLTTAVDVDKVVSDTIDEMKLTNVKIINKNTGEKIQKTEWLCTEYKGNYLINMLRYEWGEDKDIEIYIDGKKAEKIYDLRKNEYIDADNLKLCEYTPLFVRIEG